MSKNNFVVTQKVVAGMREFFIPAKLILAYNLNSMYLHKKFCSMPTKMLLEFDCSTS